MGEAYAVKSVGPRTDPRGTPAEVWVSPDDDVSTLTWSPFMPKSLSSMQSRMSLFTVSKVAEMSRASRGTTDP